MSKKDRPQFQGRVHDIKIVGAAGLMRADGVDVNVDWERLEIEKMSGPVFDVRDDKGAPAPEPKRTKIAEAVGAAVGAAAATFTNLTK